MNITDPIADMLTRIRNANTSKHKTVDVPASKMKLAIADILFKEGYIKSYEEIKDVNTQGVIRITLKYDEKGTRVIDGLKRISKPGLKVYAGKDELPKVLNGLGIAIISTSKGIMTDKQAREEGIGGEVFERRRKMSRIGNKPINVPAGVEVKIDGNHISVKGPKGTLERDVEQQISMKLEGDILTISRDSDAKKSKELHGLTRSLINNMILGVQNEFTKELQINGVGYRVQKQGNNLNLTLGYSHPVIFEAPQGISFDVQNGNTIIVKGIDKELVGQVAAEIRTKRPPEVYRGKGIKYADETIRRKVGKTGK